MKLFCSHCKKQISGKCEECDSFYEKGDRVMCPNDGYGYCETHEHYHPQEDYPDEYDVVTEEELK